MMSRIALLAALGLTTAAGATAPEGPVALAIDKQGTLVTLVVSGAATAATDVVYELDVVGASTLHQKGRATLVVNGKEQLVRATINGDRPWQATLRVTAGGKTFEQHASG